MKTYYIFFLLLITAIATEAQKLNLYSPQVKTRIKKVENNLGGWVKIQDSTGWNILDRMAYYRINGVSVAVINNYKIEWVKGYGWADTAQKIPVTISTLFQPASIGKSIHAVGTMKLVQDGRIDLHHDINAYLKRWKFPYDSLSRGKKITTLELLSHTAGLSVHGFDGYKWYQPLPNIIQILNGEPPANSPAVRSVFEPGTKFEYSGGGYAISGMEVEDVTGRPYADYMTQTIFKPLGMNHTFYYSQLTEKQKKNLATAYRFDGKDIGCKYHIYPEDACGASLWSTPADLAKFIIELQLSLKSRNNKILSSTTVKQMFTPQIEKNNALGFFIEQKGSDTYFHHDGLNEGFVADYYASIKNGNGVVIMANTDLAAYIDITEEIINSVATVYKWKGFYNPVVKKEVIVPDGVLNTYCGKYKFRDDSDQSVTVFWRNGKLWFHDSSSPTPWLMHFSSNTDFFFNEIMFNIHSFMKDTHGNIDSFMIKAQDGSFKVKKVI
ncbi:serine hydrolase domain-containing protein [Mucilaginibacter sp. OK098]|uniref:serine hydrolase domain-containing protein n=1 Tax=Mucilaginibacter sp. OK098 TaxID=1855297 RepID=UPI0009218B52|nr:serine hydrolase domain-containing protein [Mucilaginibacter sp. OK098]SHM09937.1 CubicO group peptidase, beta-lactamase class C family [Mucilaginibacter sp. OK098]